MQLILPTKSKLATAAAAVLAVATSAAAYAAAVSGNAPPHTPEELAARYMASFNAKDHAAIDKLHYPLHVKSGMQEMMDQMQDADMAGGTKYTKFEVTPVGGEMDEPHLGPDGLMYKPTIKPTHMMKLISETKDGSSSTTMPIGAKNGIYYLVTIAPTTSDQPVYKTGWQRCTMPGTAWSVMLPNEPEPGQAALEKKLGPDAMKDPDVYGVVKSTSSINMTQHWFWCGEEGKRVNAPDNREHYRAACTTYEATTPDAKQWFSDVKKNLDDNVQNRVRENEGKLVSVKEIDFAGSPGREYEIRAKDGTLVLGRNYWIKDAMYELTFDSGKESPDREVAAKFLNSLNIQ